VRPEVAAKDDDVQKNPAHELSELGGTLKLALGVKTIPLSGCPKL
jgi:hypothetical protein